jgi:hypothetical protein
MVKFCPNCDAPHELTQEEKQNLAWSCWTCDKEHELTLEDFEIDSESERETT